MVRNDRFLEKWVSYYGRELGNENLYVFFDGEDQEIPSFCNGVNATVLPKMQGDVVATDRQRAAFMSDYAARLFKEGADMVIATDADEFLVVDPELQMGLARFLSTCPSLPCYSGLGVDVLQHLDTEGKIDFNLPFLSQRHRGWLYSRYTKPSVITAPYRWGGGYHRVKGKNFHILRGLYLFHFGGVDLENLRSISLNPERVENGWTRHQQKRQRAVEKINSVAAGPWDEAVAFARQVQTWCRPIFAWNKPTTYGLKIVAKIPERFKNMI